MMNLRRSLLATSLFALFLTVTGTAFSQATTGSISARVTDPKGRVVEGAQISIVDVDKGLITNETTDSAGEFNAQALPPDSYTITVEGQGFAVVNVPAFRLDIDQKAHFDIGLKIGEASTTITVTDSAPILQTQGAETGQVVENRQITDLPLLGRNIQALLMLIPGAHTGGGGTTQNVSINGQREFGNSVQVNGVEVTGNRNNDTNVQPSPDAMQEFKVVTSGYAPEFGRASAGAVLIQTKSGTNNVHGSVYEFYRPTATTANPAVSPVGTVPTLVQNNYGATVGLPLHKDKAFLFLAYEGNRNHNTTSYLGTTLYGNQVTFDSAGDASFANFHDPYDGSIVPIFDPQAFQDAPDYESYAVQFPGNVIPANRVSPAGRRILQQMFPTPLNNGDPYGNFVVNQYFSDHNNVGNLRADYAFSQNNRIYLTYDAQQGSTYSADPYQGQTVIPTGGGDAAGTDSFENHVVGLTYDHTFSPNLLNEARATYFLSTDSENSLLAGSNLATSFGIQNANVPGYPDTYNFPQLQFYTGPTVGGSTFKPLKFRDKNLGFSDALSWNLGSHSLKFGYEYRHLNSHPDFSLFPTPYEYFDGPGSLETDDPYSGHFDGSAYYYSGGSDEADLLLGIPEVVDQGLQLTNPSTTSNEHTFYLQDYWQATKRLNITYGVRYEYQQPYVDKNNNEANLDINTLLVQLAGRGGNSRSLVNSNKTDFMPRVGIAYQIRSDLVLRAGFGMFYSPENDAREDILTKNFPFFQQQKFVNSIYAPPVFQLDTGIARSTAITIPTGASSIAVATDPANANQGFYSEPSNFPTANSKNFNVSLEQQVGNTTFTLSYVGAVTRNLTIKIGNYNVNDHLSANIGQVQTLVPEGISNYNSLQFKVDRRFSHGYSVLASYTWSHNLDNGPSPSDLNSNNGPQNPFDVNAEYSNSDLDVRHVFTAAQVLELPFGHGKHFLGNSGHIMDAIVGGWQLNSITTLQTGRPFNVLSNSGNNLPYPSLRPNLTGDPHVAHRTTREWFNTNAFTVPAGQAASTAAGQTLIVGNAPRNFLYGPGYTNEDASLIKSFGLPRAMKLQVRIEAFNVLNIAHYDAPNSNLAQYSANQKAGSFGTINGGYAPRIMQFAGRLTF